eukprot:SAG31_NODE_1609_length_7753_cov_12.390253_12_plen_50_part_01
MLDGALLVTRQIVAAVTDLERMFVVWRMFGAIRFGECSALFGEGHFDSGK